MSYIFIVPFSREESSSEMSFAIKPHERNILSYSIFAKPQKIEG